MFLLVFVTGASLTNLRADPIVQDRVDRVLERLNEQNRAGSADTFDAFSDEELIPALVTALNRTPQYESEEMRSWVYAQLARRNTVRTEVGFAQLLKGLADPAVADVCAQALLDAPAEKRDLVVERLRAYLRTATQAPQRRSTAGPNLEGVLRAVARLGADGEVYVGSIDAALHNASGDHRVRTAAAWAILRIEKLGDAVEHFSDLDPAGMEAAMNALAEQLGELLSEWNVRSRSSFAFYEENHEDIEATRAIVIRALQSSRAQTRSAAFEPMVAAYGPDIVVIRSPDDYEFNPQLRAVLADMAANDPDPTLRERATKTLDPQILKRRVARLLRLRERDAKKQDTPD